MTERQGEPRTQDTHIPDDSPVHAADDEADRVVERIESEQKVADQSVEGHEPPD